MYRYLVQIRHRRLGLVRGYAVLHKRRGRVAATHEGKQVSVKARMPCVWPAIRLPGLNRDERLTAGLNVQRGYFLCERQFLCKAVHSPKMRSRRWKTSR